MTNDLLLFLAMKEVKRLEAEALHLSIEARMTLDPSAIKVEDRVRAEIKLLLSLIQSVSAA